MNFYKHYHILLYSLVLIWLLPPRSVQAQPQPELICVSVDTDGSLYAGWTNVTGTYDGFRIFYKKSTDASYNSVDFLPGITSGTIPVADGNTEKYDVFLVTFNSSGTSAESLHLSNMLLTVSNGGIGTGIARLDWTTMKPGSVPDYVVTRSTDNITFTPIGTTSGLTFRDTIEGTCTSEVFYYRVELPLSGCTARSSLSSGTFKDDNRPEDPLLSYVTINNGLAEIHWNHSPTPDVSSYILGVKDGAVYLDHDTTDYVYYIVDDFTSRPTYRNPCTESVTYVLRSRDVCGNESSGIVNYLKLHHTILINGEVESHCNRQATITWNAYLNMTPEVTAYEVYRSENGGNPELAGTIPATAAPDYTFTDPALLSTGVLFDYWVKAINNVNTISSESCHVYLFPEIEPLTAFDLDLITVANDNHINLSASGSPDNLIHSVDIYRSSSDFANLELIGNAPWGNSPLQLNDYQALVHDNSYLYQLTARDACGYSLGESFLFRSILLSLTDMDDGNIRLNWNTFEGWGNALKQYEVYRYDGEVLASGFPKTVARDVLVYNDLLGTTQTGKVTYYVVAVHDEGRLSLSNTVYILPEAEVQVPNAFRIGGITPEFRPLLKNVEPTAYLFLVYNRWGQLIFETNDVEKGWNGSMNSSPSAPGVYVWVVNYSDYNGNKTTRRGMVTVIQ